jgi:hypothetical protein
MKSLNHANVTRPLLFAFAWLRSQNEILHRTAMVSDNKLIFLALKRLRNAESGSIFYIRSGMVLLVFVVSTVVPM